MHDFRYLGSALRLHYGRGALGALSREMDRLRLRRAMVVCGRSVAGHPDLLDLVSQALGGSFAGIFDGVRAHSPAGVVIEAAQMLERLGADAVVAVGGGSTIVTARAAAIVLAEGRDVSALATSQRPSGSLASPRLDAPKVAQFVIPTTPTTACVKAGSAVLDEVTGRRMALFDPKTRASAVFIHPQFLASAPASLVLAAAINTLAMAIEGLQAPAGNPMTDADFLQAVHLVRSVLGRVGSIDDEAARGELMLAAVLCGRGTDHAGGGVCSALSHACGARTGADNGFVNAVLLPLTVAFNLELPGRCMERRVLRPHGAEAIADVLQPAALRRLLEAAGAPSRLRDLQVRESDLDEIARAAAQDWFLQQGPRPVEGVGQLRNLLERAW
ncbi:MAG: iron-containing alcohol dehydrogenase [Variovorax sp.]|nr:iron-containing alcohol dehydrogenase [Variovorax sp.]